MAQHVKTKYPGVTYILVKGVGGNNEKSFYVRYRIGGRGSKEIREPVGRESEGMTAAKAAQIRADRARGKELPNAQQRAKRQEQDSQKKYTIDLLWKEYKNDNPHLKGIVTDESRYNKHINKKFGSKEAVSITTMEINEFKKFLFSQNYAPQTVKNYLELLRRIISYGKKTEKIKTYILNNDGQIEQFEPRFEMPTVDNQKTEFLTDDQIKNLQKALDEDYDQNGVAMIRLALATGMRRGAIFGLQWKDIDFDRNFIMLRGAEAKKEKTEILPMNETTRAILINVTKTESPYVFPGKNGGKRVDIRHLTNRIKKKAGLPEDFRPMHGLRHTFASLLASSGKVDMYQLQKLLTHQSADMTRRYSHLRDKALKDATSVMDNIFSSIANS